MVSDVGETAPEASPVDALVIGAGPAGLMAAEMLAARGARVVVAEAKPSVGRKFLMAGKSGLNLTFDAGPDALLTHYRRDANRLSPMIRSFDAAAIRNWAAGLGQETFAGSSGRVFPVAMKASPLLRAWLGRLSDAGVEIRTRLRWTGWRDGVAQFDTGSENVTIPAKTTVLALGGASWARLGSDGLWAPFLEGAGVDLAPFKPSNAGLVVDWSPHMSPHFGAAVKGTRMVAGQAETRGEFVISERGLEGGGIYTIFAAVRDGAALFVDLCPDWSVEDIQQRLARVPAKASRSNKLRKALRLDRSKIALFNEWAPDGSTPEDLPRLLKALAVPHAGPRPMDEAISTAGGVRWDAVGDDLMLHALPGVYVAGEMLDWDAPTGGYLLTACLATGRWAGCAAADRLGL